MEPKKNPLKNLHIQWNILKSLNWNYIVNGCECDRKKIFSTNFILDEINMHEKPKLKNYTMDVTVQCSKQ